MTTHSKNIYRLIKAIAKNKVVFFPFIIWDEKFDGVRVNGTGYELFQTIEILEDELSGTLHCSQLEEEDEQVIQRILEQILIDQK